MKPFLKNVTLVVADTTSKVKWSSLAIERSLEQCDFAAVKLLTNREDLKYAVKIPDIKGLDGYSNFCVRDMARHVETPFALVIQYDGFVLNGAAWSDEFEQYDFIGAPTDSTGIMQNGGMSLRSKRLLDFISKRNWPSCHPEDFKITVEHRREIEAAGFKFAPYSVARKFSAEGRSWDGQEWQSTFNSWSGQFGFHSLLTNLPKDKMPCKVAVHSLDAGDCIYGLATLKALGGAMLFITPKNNYPYPLDSRWTRMGGEASVVDNLAPLIEAQSYMVGCRYTHGNVHSCDYDLNRFRLPWKNRTARDWESIKKLHCDAFGVSHPDSEPWLTVQNPTVVKDRPIVISRSPRYHNDEGFKWHEFVQRYSDQCVFVGLDSEAEIFQGFTPPKARIPHYKTKDALELSRVIAGSKVFVGNQSLPLAIAHGLCKNVIVEEWPLNRNCHLEREGAIYPARGKTIEIPESWLI